MTPADSPNPGVYVLAIDMKNVTATTLAVTLTPVASASELPDQPKVAPLNTW
jgi:phage terminase large subunit-like protein